MDAQGHLSIEEMRQALRRIYLSDQESDPPVPFANCFPTTRQLSEIGTMGAASTLRDLGPGEKSIGASGISTGLLKVEVVL